MNENSSTNFIIQMLADSLASGKHQAIVTRFPPEPNGYLHIGHAKSICLNFGLADHFKGKCFLRFDDTNPLKEDDEYVNSIIADVKWLGFSWCAITYASDYYEEIYTAALHLIEHGLAYVDSSSFEEIRALRGSLTEPGVNSPYRNRSIAENLELFTAMRAGKFQDGAHVLRAKIDMGSGNVNMRDPVLYRIRHTHHQRTGDNWCIYPMYDYAHPLCDAFEHITHSLCTLEFQDHRPLYDWVINNLPLPSRPVQTEFARLNISHTVTSKRKLRDLVAGAHVRGWDDPRLLTIGGLRERGYPAAAIRNFCEAIGVSRSDSVIDLSVLENEVRDVLNQTSARLFAVIDPIKVVLENYDGSETLEPPLYPHDPSNTATRSLPFARELYIERADFFEVPPPGFRRLTLGGVVRLRHAYVIKCHEVIKDDTGKIIELRCTYDKDTLGKNPVDYKARGVIHWLAKDYAIPAQITQYTRLFDVADPGRLDDFIAAISPDTMLTSQGFVEPYVLQLNVSDVQQFERLGYYRLNAKTANYVVMHLVVSLKEDKVTNTW
jgi:glutaminyl-tRNA synthetase